MEEYEEWEEWICGEDECERKCQEEMEMRGEDDLFEEWEEEE